MSSSCLQGQVRFGGGGSSLAPAPSIALVWFVVLHGNQTVVNLKISCIYNAIQNFHRQNSKIGYTFYQGVQNTTEAFSVRIRYHVRIVH